MKKKENDSNDITDGVDIAFFMLGIVFFFQEKKYIFFWLGMRAKLVLCSV